MKIHRFLWRGLVLVGALGCLSFATYYGPVGRISGIVVTAQGSDSPRDLCAGFSVSPAKVRTFFRTAILITRRQEHDNFLHGPCYVRGTFSTSYESWRWEIRNMGTATLTSASGDDTFVFADTAQESPLSID